MIRITIPFLLALFALFSLPVTSPGEAMYQRIDNCPGSLVQYRGRTGAMTCHCDARAASSGTVWGTDIYTDDSRVCRAAVHAGRISERGGNVRVVFLGGQNRFEGSRRNGVRTSDYGRWPGSFRFASGNYGGQPGSGYPGGDRVEDCPSNATQWRGRRDRRSCYCDAGATRSGSVWGTETYTDDSRICRAALHAGVIGNRGGVVTLETRGGRSSYRGSRRNGVRTSDYGRWSGSYVFVGGGSGGSGGYVPPNTPYPPLRPPSGGEVSNCPGYGFALRAAPGRVTCRCTRTGVSAGQVFGTNVYSERSAVCRAALHAGAVGRDGGVVTIFPGGGQSSFRGSSRNGVMTLNAGQADYSFRFGR
ncbi:LCCL domain-containing protein [Parasphingopyxis sp.]|uniref:LCCL domain-containing protein n=1 Tax=Parasphingopyxis sp. TaxID=1920299 RepID=UPI00262CB08C|nr:LCCL domain-containing protein [Parasphingopyxis sp.]